MKNSLMPDFSKEQLLAINHFTGPALVIAGPGSGKTAVIVNRIHTLIHKQNVNPQNILVITFSKMAANEMQLRFNNLCKNTESVLPVSFGTFHSVFFNIISKIYHYSTRDIISITEIRTILKYILSNFIHIDNTENEFVDSLYKRISYYKNSSFKHDKKSLCEIDDNDFMQIFDEYQSQMRNTHRIDFEDMMLICRNLLLNNLDIRKQYQKRYEFIMVDEYQDINELQYEVLKLLINDSQNIFVVGDDDQAIYGFRGSKPEIMANFGREFNNAKIIKLTCCYRCSKNIISMSNAIIRDNQNRYCKEIYTNNESGGEVNICKYESRESEYNAIALEIKKEYKTMESNYAVLFRTNTMVATFVDTLIKNNIDFIIKEHIQNPYASSIFGDFCHYMNLSLNIHEMPVKEIIAVMNKPLRYMNRQIMVKDIYNFDELRVLYKEKTYMLDRINKFEKDLIWLSKMDIYAAFNYFRKAIGYEEYIIQKNGTDDFRVNNSKNTFDDLQRRLEDFTTYKEVIMHAAEFEKKIKPPSSIKVQKTGIYVMTYHASKGLEFDTVYIPGLNEGEVPNKKSTTVSQIEEERRMLYVAMTRAKYRLKMSYVDGNEMNKGFESRFIRKLI